MSKVSIIIPFYNEEFALPRCLDSVLVQTHRDIEVILADGASTDGSGKLADAYAATDSRIKVIHQARKNGTAGGRNDALAVATGEYVQFVDADDRILPHMTEQLVGAMENGHPDMVACGYANITVGREGETCQSYTPNISGEVTLEEYLAKCCHQDMRWLIFMGSVWSKLYRLDIIRENDLMFDGSIYSDDLLFTITYYCHCRRVRVVALPLYQYITGGHSGQMTTLDRYFTDNTRSILHVARAFENTFAQRLPRIEFETCLGRFASVLIATVVNLCRRDATIPRNEILSRIAEVSQSDLVQTGLKHYRPKSGQSRLIPLFLKWRLNVLVFIAGRLRAERRYWRHFIPENTRKGLAWFS